MKLGTRREWMDTRTFATILVRSIFYDFRQECKDGPNFAAFHEMMSAQGRHSKDEEEERHQPRLMALHMHSPQWEI